MKLTSAALINPKRSLQTFTFQDEVGKMVLNICEVMVCFCDRLFYSLLDKDLKFCHFI